MNNIENMTRDELIEFAKKFNIFNIFHEIPDRVETRQKILDRMNALNVTNEEVNPIADRIVNDQYRTIVINTYRNY
jgi:hypothetical protein